jgi:hypothetical protein
MTDDTRVSGDDERRFQYCALPPRPAPVLPPEVAADPERSRAIIAGRTKWANHTVLHYWFFDGGPWAVPDNQAEVVRAAFTEWKDLGIGLEFTEVSDAAQSEFRIGYLPGDGSWSYIARAALDRPLTERTMSFGWRLDADPYGRTTALHEIGHALGLPHEHQNPFAGIVWDEEAVYAELGGPPNNWDPETVFHNVLRKLERTEVEGSEWDPDSIMEYDFPPGLVLKPEQYRREGIHPPGTVSPIDKEWARKWYPGDAPAARVLEPFQSIPVDLAAGEQADFTIHPPSDREYTIATFGGSDTVLVVFEDVAGQWRYLAGDDDSGTDRNASVTVRLRAGRTYAARLRLYYPGESGRAAVMCW